MSITKSNAAFISPVKYNLRRRKFGAILSSDHSIPDDQYSHDTSSRISIDSSISSNDPSSPYSNSSISTSPFSESSPYAKSPWTKHDSSYAVDEEDDSVGDMKTKHGLLGSLFRDEGHVHSLATTGDLLLTGSESKNIRVWKNLEEFSGFKSSSGFVKAIVVLGDRVFTGHEDGKIRVWVFQGDKYKRVGTLPTTRDLLMKSVNPRNYIQVRRKRTVPWVKHDDAVSCMSVDSDLGLLYSGSWDKTLKVWRISDFKCLESINGHDDSVNSVAVGFDGLVFTGSADGSVKAWRRELVGKHVKHMLVETLLKQEEAVTSLVVNRTTLYAGTSDGLVSFWEREKHFMMYSGVLRGHKLAVLCLATGGNLVMSGSADKNICVWRRQVGGVHTCVAVLEGHNGPVKCLAVEEEEEGDGHCIVYSGSLDNSVKVWSVSECDTSLKEVHD